MKKKWNRITGTILSLVLLSSVGFTSCNNEADELDTEGNKKLAINVGINPQSRAIITESTLPTGSEIGILLASDAADYDAINNFKFTASGTGESQTWTPQSDVLLTDSKATLYAYYPYAEGTDLAAINIETASQTDYLYATPVGNVSEDNPTANLTMNHILTNINLTFADGSYVGEGNITEVSVQGEGIATGGVFNAAQQTPAFTSFTGENTVTTAVTTTLGGNPANVMVVSKGESKPITITATIDGVKYTATSQDVTFEKGKSYNYTLTLNSTFLSINKIALVNPWDNEDKDAINMNK